MMRLLSVVLPLLFAVWTNAELGFTHYRPDRAWAGYVKIVSVDTIKGELTYFTEMENVLKYPLIPDMRRRNEQFPKKLLTSGAKCGLTLLPGETYVLRGTFFDSPEFVMYATLCDQFTSLITQPDGKTIEFKPEEAQNITLNTWSTVRATGPIYRHFIDELIEFDNFHNLTCGSTGRLFKI